MRFDPTPFIGKFTQEAQELLQKLNEHLICLEKAPDNQDTIRELMRTAHTLKGSSKILRFHAMSQLAHNMEDLLSSLYEGRIAISGQILDLLFAGTDLLGRCLEVIGREHAESVDITPLAECLERAGRGEQFSSVPLPESPERIPLQSSSILHDSEDSIGSPTDVLQAIPPGGQESLPPEPGDTSHTEARSHEAVRIDVQRVDNTIRLVSEMTVSHRKSERELHILKDILHIARKHAGHIQHTLPRGGTNVSETQRADLLHEGQHIVMLLDRLVNEHRDETAMMDLVLNELYDEVLKMRMLPLSTVFQTFPRAVRDMARHFHKQIDLRIQGGETTLDKKIIEKLGNPLIHILRNCIDHGIETPQERQKQGKPPIGRITIQARQHSGHVELRITDDGRGIQTEKLRQRLITRGLRSEEQVRKMDDAEVMDTVFWPGTSTSDIITDISGRGFGMDIVKTEIERLKGSVMLTSQAGEGTQCLFSLPVTSTTLRCLIVTAGGDQFAIPIESIEETLYISHHECIQVVEHDAIRLRNQMIYVVPLANLLQLPRTSKQRSDKVFILIAHSAGKRVGLIVDDILDEQDVVVKQLPTHIRSLKTVAGATISGENAVVLILHIPEIISLVGHTTERRDAAGFAASSTTQARILLVEDSVSTSEIEKLILESQGYRVDVASDGLTALRELEKVAYDAIITDIEMPGLDGFSLTEHIRQLPDYRQVPIIIVTSLERDSDKQRGIQVGADAYITKGDFEQSRLVETIKSLL